VEKITHERLIMTKGQRNSFQAHLSKYEMEREQNSPNVLLLDRLLSNARNYYYKKNLEVDTDLNERFLDCKMSLNRFKKEIKRLSKT
jgi:hypothetical protein